jgi:ATP-dependent RNA helicase DeaD
MLQGGFFLDFQISRRFERERKETGLKMTFSAFGLIEPLKLAVAKLGFHQPTPIQTRALAVLLAGNTDFIGLAQTGTGKTAAYGLALLQQIADGGKHPRAVVLCPTRELCQQIAADLRQLATFLPAVRIATVYGGAGIADQIRQLRFGAQVVVATPGRALDLIQRGALSLNAIQVAVLDEADEMLRMGFKEDMDRILAELPAERHVWLFSATMAPAVNAVARAYLNNPARVAVDGAPGGPEGMAHRCYCVLEKHRYAALRRLIDPVPAIRALVFCRTRSDAQTLADRLAAEGCPAEALHGDLGQSQRDAVMGRFRRGALQVLVATDVAARGLDVDDITHVIHYQLPDDAQIYTHRSGRTARAGRSGLSVVLATPREQWQITNIERSLKLHFQRERLPDIRTVCRQRLASRLKDFAATPVTDPELDALMPTAVAALEGLDRDALIQRLVAVEYSRRPQTAAEENDLNARPVATARPPLRQPARSPQRGRQPFRQPARPAEARHFCIDVGQSKRINAGAVVRCICDAAGIRSNLIGAIRLDQTRAFFEVQACAADQVRKSADRVRLDGRPVQVRPVAAGAAPQGKAARTRYRPR